MPARLVLAHLCSNKSHLGGHCGNYCSKRYRLQSCCCTLAQSCSPPETHAFNGWHLSFFFFFFFSASASASAPDGAACSIPSSASVALSSSSSFAFRSWHADPQVLSSAASQHTLS